VRLIHDNSAKINAQIASARKKQTDAIITAPTGGMITTLYFHAGEAIPPLGNIVELLQTKELDVKIYVSAALVTRLKIGQQLPVRLEGETTEIPAHIQWISSQAEFTPKTVLTPETRSSLVYAVQLRLENADGKLKQGMPVEVKIPQSDK
jgi:HlyD family secretion protein